MYNPYDWYISPEEYAEAERNGINAHLLESRIRRHGWGKRKAITKPRQVQLDRTVIMKVTKENGITYDQFKKRLNRGWDEQTAATIPTRDLKWQAELARYIGQHRNRKYPREMVELATVYKGVAGI